MQIVITEENDMDFNAALVVALLFLLAVCATYFIDPWPRVNWRERPFVCRRFRCRECGSWKHHRKHVRSVVYGKGADGVERVLESFDVEQRVCSNCMHVMDEKKVRLPL